MEFKKIGNYKLYYTSKGIYFNYEGQRRYLHNALRIHNNMWFNNEGYPDYIHAVYNLFTCNAGSRDIFLNVDEAEAGNDLITVYKAV